ncbi:hypothetical protein BT69DRAFT_1284154, partial [Atractiella rhizophila]
MSYPLLLWHRPPPNVTDFLSSVTPLWTAPFSPVALVNLLGANILIGDIDNGSAHLNEVRRCTLADIYVKRRSWVRTHMWGSNGQG